MSKWGVAYGVYLAGLFCFGVAGAGVRFSSPTLTETQLFLQNWPLGLALCVWAIGGGLALWYWDRTL